MAISRRPDFFAQVLGSLGYFRGKTRLADFLGRSVYAWNRGPGTIPLANGRTVTVDLGDRIQRLMWGAAYEPHVRRCLGLLLKPGDVFVDVGAHIGFFSLLAASWVGSRGKVFAFEADSELFQKLQSNAAEYSWFKPYFKAVWKESGSLSFSNPHQPGETGWGKLATVRDEGNLVTVEAISLDEWHESVGGLPVRLVKIDAEGSEPFILQGAQHLFTKARPYLIIELNDELLREVGQSQELVANLLKSWGYTIITITAAGFEERIEGSGTLSPEVLCVPSEKLDEAKRVMFS
jgi:FkbM family methyltransferase